MVMEKEAGLPSVPGPARLWVELQATVNKVRRKCTMLCPPALAQQKPRQLTLMCLLCTWQNAGSFTGPWTAPIGCSSPRASERRQFGEQRKNMGRLSLRR